MCRRLGCIFGDLPEPHRFSGNDNYTKLLIIGASGMTGNAVMEAAVACVWFRVVAFTRNPDSLVDNPHVKKGKVSVVKGDMLEMDSLSNAMMDIDVVFFTTAYWDTRDKECEYKQHLLYAGTPYSSRHAEVPCKCLAAKEKVQQLVLNSGVPCTIIQMGFYYENFVSIFKPHPVEPLTYAVALPMGNVSLNCGSVLDFAHCIAKIILHPNDYIGVVIKLSTGYHTLTQLVAWMDRQLPDVTIFDPKITIDEYETINYEGSEEMCAMFKFLLSPVSMFKWDQKLAYELCPSARSFTSWLEESEKAFVTCLKEDQVCDEIGKISVEISLASETLEHSVITPVDGSLILTRRKTFRWKFLIKVANILRSVRIQPSNGKNRAAVIQ
ncbi:NmrA-like family domain-containing protein 1 [Elysia marginata]|uniref:NmrA-like family domain-containing protein 1 n=1 Tax=Elysia marginata TaxID=1093978 RepID=A0AAV4EMQ4_9GAST|nr:NmrA-like family domain-containing protein 1 [Elysia marginata]